MNFPLTYSEDFLPKPIIKILDLIRFLHRLISTSFNAVGLGDILDSHTPLPNPPNQPHFCSISANLIKQMLPSIQFKNLLQDNSTIADGCAVCLSGFEASETIRPLSNCSHVFHQRCLDQWIELGERTCPLCRKLLVPLKMVEVFDRQICAYDQFYDEEFIDDFLPPLSPS